jgi:hypothetical protein
MPPSNPEEKRLRHGPLAAAMGVSRWFLRAMKIAGFPMPGGTALKSDGDQWLKEHPEFLASRVMKEHRESRRDLGKPVYGAALPGRRRGGERKSGELLSRHD